MYKRRKFTNKGAEWPQIPGYDLGDQMNPHTKAGHQKVRDTQIQYQEIGGGPHLLIQRYNQDNQTVPHHIDDDYHDVERDFQSQFPCRNFGWNRGAE